MDSDVPPGPHLKVRGYRAPADIDQLCHVIVGIKGPHAAFQVQVFVELDGFWLSHTGVKLEWAVIARTQSSAVIDYIIQKPCLCRVGRNKEWLLGVLMPGSWEEEETHT
jgi:hypothetical protein